MATEQETLTKAELIKSLEKLPDDATVEDFLEHLAFIVAVQEGLADIEAGNTISHEELLSRIKHWRP